MRRILFIFLIALGGQSLFAQYRDHRNRKTDSLEMVLNTRTDLSVDEQVDILETLTCGLLPYDNAKTAEYARRCIALVDKTKRHKSVANAWKNLGLSYYGRCVYDSAHDCFIEGLKVMDKAEKEGTCSEYHLDDERGGLYGSIANNYNMQGRVHLALDYYLKTLEIYQKINAKECQVISLFNMGELYLELGNNAEAADHYGRAREIALLTGDSLMVSMPSSGLAMTSLNQGQYEDAERYARESMVYYMDHLKAELGGVCDSYTLLSRVYHLGYNDLDKAQQMIDSAMYYFQGSEEKGNTRYGDAMAQQAAICLARKDWRLATTWAERALKADDQDPQHNIGLYKTLAEAYNQLGKKEQAQHYIGLLYDTMAEQSTGKYQSALSDMEIRYETAQKEAQIHELEQQQRYDRLQNRILIIVIVVVILGIAAFLFINRQRQSLHLMEAKLSGERDERTRLGRDLHDRLGGLLTAIHLAIEEGSDQEKMIALADEATREMRRIAHHLMPASLAKHGLVTALRDFCQVHPMVRFSLLGADIRIDPQREVLLYCIVHELVNNAMKHAQARRIQVQLMMEPAYTAVIVSDDGKGFDVQKALKKTGAGMGLSNIQERVSLMGGRVDISSSDHGTEINIEIKN